MAAFSFISESPGGQGGGQDGPRSPQRPGALRRRHAAKPAAKLPRPAVKHPSNLLPGPSSKPAASRREKGKRPQGKRARRLSGGGLSKPCDAHPPKGRCATPSCGGRQRWPPLWPLRRWRQPPPRRAPGWNRWSWPKPTCCQCRSRRRWRRRCPHPVRARPP